MGTVISHYSTPHTVYTPPLTTSASTPDSSYFTESSPLDSFDCSTMSAFADPPLSPGGFSGFVNMDMLEDGQSAGPSESIDLFKYYLDLNSMQGKAPEPSPSMFSNAASNNTFSASTPSSQTLSLADIEQYQSLLNSNQNAANSGSAPNNADQQIYPFAEAASFPPSAFSPPSISNGSEEPINPALIAGLFANNDAATASAPSVVG